MTTDPKPTKADPTDVSGALFELERLRLENRELRSERDMAFRYIRDKVDQLLVLMGTVPLRPEELDDAHLIHLDPIGIIRGSFGQILQHLREKNDELNHARNEIRALFDSAGAAMLVLDPDLNILDYNHVMQDLFFKGRNPEEILGKSCDRLLCAEDTQKNTCTVSDVLATGNAVRRNDWRCRGRHFDVIGVPLFDNDGRIARIILSYTDITDLVLTRNALMESEERYRDILENASDLILSMNPKGVIQYANRAWCKTIACPKEEAPGSDFFNWVHPEDRESCASTIHDSLKDGQPVRLETRLISHDERTIVVEGIVSFRFEKSRPVSLRTILRDVTETRKLYEEILRVQKLDSIGVLAGGIAHDFNNLLTIIIGNLSLLKSGQSEKNPAWHLLTNAEAASAQAQHLTQQLLTFAKGGAPVKSIASLQTIVDNAVRFCLHGSNVSCDVLLTDSLMPVKVDVGQMNQVIQNLVINASQAMPNGGHMTIHGENRVIHEHKNAPVNPGSYVCLNVRDEGVGIPAGQIAKIFDPFFTTKSKGSGLGLATCFSIMKRHGGHISVESTVGKGTVFTLMIPASPDSALPENPATEAEIRPASGRILVMDDQDLVRKVAASLLEEVGYTVDTAEDGKEAIELYRKARETGRPYCAVILDMTVPGGMGGLETLTHIKLIDPDVRAIVSSGYANDPVMADYQSHGFSGVVTKPFDLGKLAGAVRLLS